MTLVIDGPGAADVLGALTAADVPELLAMHGRCSPASRYARWHGHLSLFPRRYLNSMLEDEEHVAVIARVSGTLVGLASAAPVAPGVREIGILVEDAWQRHGIGGQLLGATLAASAGTAVLRAEVLLADRRLLLPLTSLGPMTTRTSRGVVEAEVLLRS